MSKERKMGENSANVEVIPLKKRKLLLSPKEYDSVKPQEEEDVGMRVSNPLTLVAIAAAWFAGEDNTELLSQEKAAWYADENNPEILTQEYAIKDESETSDENERRSRLTKPRSRIRTKKRTHYSSPSELLKQGKLEEEESPIKKTRKGLVCSRVNGKGWRCSQLTKDGNALCEHHLGRARLVRLRKAGQKRPAGVKKRKK